ncbi:MAG TPA: hypothetical protein VOA87_00945 [Thermoanaerobaculia bacterium]|nr:hypothetical protein [Thermoanaerobaculia bacterium]
MIGFLAPVVFSGHGDGTFEAQAPLLALISAGQGAVVAPPGAFHLILKGLPPTCTLGCLEPGTRCGESPGGNCYLFDSNFLCCTVCPTGSYTSCRLEDDHGASLSQSPARLR